VGSHLANPLTSVLSATLLIEIMKLLTLIRSKFLTVFLAGVCALDVFAMTGCVYPVGAGVAVGPPPPLPGPVVSVGVYGTPAGYYYRNYPVYIYRGRRVYYYGGRRYYYRPGNRFYYRRGYRYYY